MNGTSRIPKSARLVVVIVFVLALAAPPALAQLGGDGCGGCGVGDPGLTAFVINDFSSSGHCATRDNGFFDPAHPQDAAIRDGIPCTPSHQIQNIGAALGAPEDDDDFVGMSDQVTYRVHVQGWATPLTVAAEFLDQPVSYPFATDLR